MSASLDAAAIARKRLPLLPSRSPKQGGSARFKTHLDTTAEQAGGLFWKCAVEIAKAVYARIDARYPDPRDAAAMKSHAMKMAEAKKILNENRNEVLEVVMPLFSVKPREPGHPQTEADKRAYEYIVENYLAFTLATYKAWADQFVEADEVEALERTLDKIYELQKERLTGMLLNFTFEFRPLAHAKGARKLV